ncbi:hypothetical protein LTR70_006643 [Exophiala xenobiotica]|uniref:Uncharacterized protein n=1 Tax=Lithohypha guttulata TaxID=1690604 RepID=A0ABR0KNK6_9EURO|nr:hypothetical protein LTR24_000359 [Lithohypha guttulata]KAK5315652.1 hypothetical protein LTR70_006643 [Exophiala xenobiotica]
MANRPSSELFLPKSSARRHEDESIEHEIVTRINQRSSKSPDATRRQTLASLVEQKWTDLHAGEVSAQAQEHSRNLTPNNDRSITPMGRSNQVSTYLLDATPSPSWVKSAKHNLRETSQTRATLTQKAADLYATASGIIPPYLSARLTELGALDEEDDNPQFPLGLDPSEQIDQVKFFLMQLGRVLDRLSDRRGGED